MALSGKKSIEIVPKRDQRRRTEQSRRSGGAAYSSMVLTFPIRTERLTLAPLTQSEREAFVAYRRVPDIARWQGWTSDYSEADADVLIASQPSSVQSRSGRWLQLAARRGDSTLVGDVAVHAVAEQPDTYELGVTMTPAFHGAGYATEAVGAVVGRLFAHGAHRVFAVTDARNEPVARLFRRLGFRHEGRNVAADWHKGEWTSIDTWAALRDDPGMRSRP